MKVLLVCALALVSVRALDAKVFDLSKVKSKLPPANSIDVPKKDLSLPQRASTVNIRAICGQPNPPATSSASRIIGSWDAGVHEFPWMVAIWKDEMILCGGSLISDQWVLTAAHCADGTVLFNIWVGAHKVQEFEDYRVQVRFNTSAENNIVHPGWDANTHKDDIALIKLPFPIELSDIIRPICLPVANEANQRTGEVDIISGWGRPAADTIALTNNALRKTNVTVISNAACREVYGDIVTDDHLCIRTEDGHATCTCDTGGPLSHVNEDGTFTQIGVVSFAHISGCENGYPAGFSRVSNYVEWISEVTGIAL